jgi:hypothetical protein
MMPIERARELPPFVTVAKQIGAPNPHGIHEFLAMTGIFLRKPLSAGGSSRLMEAGTNQLSEADE